MIALLLVGCGSAEERKASYMSKAQAFFTEGNFPKARVALRNVIKIDPKDTEAYYLLAQVAEKEENWRKAFGLYMKIADIDATHRGAQTRLARFYLAAKQKDNVAELADEMLAHDPNDILGETLKASVLYLDGEKEKSLAMAESLAARNTTDPDTSILLAAVFSANSQFEQATVVLNRGLDAQPKNVDLLKNLATTYLRMGKVLKAEETYAHVLALEPTVFAHRERLARLYLQLQKPEKALALLRDAVELEPDNEDRWISLVQYSEPVDREQVLLEGTDALPYSTRLRFLLGQYYEGQQDFQKAREIYEALAAEEDTTDEALKAEVQLARLDLTDKKRELANSRLEKVLQESPRQPDALLLKGKMALAEKEGQTAVQAFRTVLKDQPNQSTVQSLLGQGHFLSGEFDLAEESFQKAIELNSRQFDAYLALARLSFKRRDFSKAQGHLETILKSSPKHLESLGLLFKLQLAQKQWAEAEETLIRLREGGGFAYSVDLAEGFLAQSRQQWDRALQAFGRAQKAKPNALAPLSAIVKVELHQKRANHMEQYLETILSEQPDHPFASGLLGAVHLHKQDRAAAVTAFQRQTQINPTWVGPWKDWARLTWAEGRKTEAIEILKRGVSQNPNALTLSTSLASLYEMDGEIDLAIHQYKTILEKNPNVVAVANNLAYLYAEKKGDPHSLKEALALAKDFETQNPNPLLLDTLAWVNYKMGLNNEALGLLRQAVKRAPNHPLLHYHYGVVALKAGDHSTAKKHIEIAVQSGSAFANLKEARQLLARLNSPS